MAVAEQVRLACIEDASTVADLLDAFNREFATPTPGPAVLKSRLRQHLPARMILALLVGEPAVGVAVVTLRPSVWYEGPVGLLEEPYVIPARRNQRLGAALLTASEDVVRRRGGDLLEINVDADDVKTRRFYESHGYANQEPGGNVALLYYYRELGILRS